MKKFCYLISVGLLGTLVSCGEDEIVNINTGGNITEELADYTVKARIVQTASVSGEDNMYVWNSQDAFTLWNRNTGKGYGFTVLSSDGGASATEAEFTGKAALLNDPQLLAVFPQREAVVFSDLSTCLIDDTTSVQDFRKNLYMVAAGKVTDGVLPALEFSPLTALLQFDLKNISDKTLQVQYVTLESKESVFPEKLTIGNDGSIRSLSGTRKGVTLDVNHLNLESGEEETVYLNMLPTTTGEENLLQSSSELSIKVTVLNDGVSQVNEVWNGTVRELPLVAGTMDETACQFVSGHRYPMTVNVDKLQIPEEGYLVDSEGDVHIYNETGLANWAVKAADFGDATVTLEKDYIEDLTLTLSGAWTAVSEFSGVLEGNGVTITGATLLSTDDNIGFIGVNKGTIKDLIFADMTLNVDVAGTSSGVLAARNEGEIINCAVGGATNIKVTGAGGNIGALVGYNEGKLIGSSVGTEVSLTYSGNNAEANIGGLVGWNHGGDVTGCHASATLNLEKGANAGGLAGSAWSAGKEGTIGASYAAGRITVASGLGTWAVGGLAGNGGTTESGAKVNIIGCYSTTELPADAATGNKKKGGLVGKAVIKQQGASIVTLAFKECYYMNEVDKPVNAGEVEGAEKLETAADILPYLSEINRSITGSGFKYVENTASDKEKEPLVLEPADEGVEGPGFGDGGEI